VAWSEVYEAQRLVRVWRGSWAVAEALHAISAATGAPSPGESFLQRSTWAEFRAVLAGLRE